jgi:hypothetical protein
MKFFDVKSAALMAALAAAMAAPAQAAVPPPMISITEVAPWGSGIATYAADWFEVTNISAAAINITGWTMDDNSNSFTSSVALRGVTSIAAGQSVIFLEGNATGSTDAAINASFKNAWFGSHVPAGLTLGNYGGSGVGLSSTADAVNIFNAAGNLQANVSFNASTNGLSFDNAAKLNNSVISQLSVAGVNGAFVAANDASQIGSPGTLAAVPEPASSSMMLAGLGLMGFIARRRKA